MPFKVPLVSYLLFSSTILSYTPFPRAIINWLPRALVPFMLFYFINEQSVPRRRSQGSSSRLLVSISRTQRTGRPIGTSLNAGAARRQCTYCQKSRRSCGKLQYCTLWRSSAWEGQHFSFSNCFYSKFRSHRANPSQLFYLVQDCALSNSRRNDWLIQFVVSAFRCIIYSPQSCSLAVNSDGVESLVWFTQTTTWSSFVIKLLNTCYPLVEPECPVTSFSSAMLFIIAPYVFSVRCTLFWKMMEACCFMCFIYDNVRFRTNSSPTGVLDFAFVAVLTIVIVVIFDHVLF